MIREGWKFSWGDELDDSFERLYGKNKFKVLPTNLMHELFGWKTGEWGTDKKNKKESFRNFVNRYKSEFKYFVLWEFNEGAMREVSLLEYYRLFKSVDVEPKRVIFLNSNMNINACYDELGFSESERFHLISDWWKSASYFTGAELRERDGKIKGPVNQVDSVWDELIENFNNRKKRNPSKLFIATMESSRGERQYFFEQLQKKGLLKFGHVSYRDRGFYLDNKDKRIMVDVDNHFRFFDTKPFFNDAHISIVMESDAFSIPKYWDGLNQSGRLTEKTMWPIFWGKPFFVIGPKSPLSSLKNIGLKTFSNSFDETYDDELDIFKRIDMVVTQIENLSKLSEEELKLKLKNTEESVLHNFEFYKNLSYKTEDEILQYFFEEQAKKLNIL